MTQETLLTRARGLAGESPAYARLAAGQGLWYLGVETWYLVLPFVVLRLEGSAFWMGVIATAGYLPTLAGAALAGWWADLAGARTVMLAGAGGRAMLFLALAASAWSGALSLPVMALACLLLGLCGTAQNTARRAMVPRLVASGRVPLANSIDELLYSGSAILGTLIGGAVLSGLPLHWPMLLLATLQLGYAALIAGLPQVKVEHPAARPRLREGLDFLRDGGEAGRTALAVVALAFVVFGGSVTFFSFQVYYYGSALGLAPREAGSLVIAVSLLGLAGPLLAEKMLRRLGAGPALAWQLLAVAAGLALAGLSRGRLGVVLGAGLVLAGSKAGRVSFTTLLHWVVPARMMGRVTGVYSTFSEGGAVILSTLLAGSLAKSVGLPATFLAASAGCFLCLVAFLASPLRSLDSSPAKRAGAEAAGA